MRPGISRLRFVLTILREARVPDGAGGFATAWGPVDPAEEMRCSVRGVNVSRIDTEHSTELLRRKLIRVRTPALPADFSAALRVRVEGQDYIVISHAPIEGTRRFTDLVCNEVI